MTEQLDKKQLTSIMYQVQRRHVSGHSLVKVLGFDDTVEHQEFGDLSLTPNTIGLPRTLNKFLELVSTSDDDSDLGAGIGGILIVYLDSNYDEKEKTILLNGTTPVLINLTDIQELQYVCAIPGTLGISGGAVGTITLREISSGDSIECITPGRNQSSTAKRTIPRGFTGYLVGWRCSAMKQLMTFHLKSDITQKRELALGVFHIQDTQLSESGGPSGFIDTDFALCPAKSTTKVMAKAEAAGAQASAGFTILLIRNIDTD